MSPSNITLGLLFKKGICCLQTKTKKSFHKTQVLRCSYHQGVSSEVSDIPSDRALVPPSMVGRYLGQNRPLMPKFVANGPKYSSSSNCDPIVWGVKVDDQTHPADPVKVVFSILNDLLDLCYEGEALPGQDQQGGGGQSQDVLHRHHCLPPLLGSPLSGWFNILNFHKLLFLKVTLTNWHWDFEDAKQSMAHEVRFFGTKNISYLDDR